MSPYFLLHYRGRDDGKKVSFKGKEMTHPAYHNTWEEPYLGALDDALKTGDKRNVRNGVTKAKFVTHLEYDLSQGLPIITTKFVPLDIVLAELLWFIEGGRKPNPSRGEIAGRLSTHRLSEIAGREVKIWNGDAANFAGLGKALFDGDCGRIYGAQWRDFSKYEKIPQESGGRQYYKRSSIDQLQNLINDLKNNPNGRYARVTAWNPAELSDMSLPACHCTFQCFVGPDEYGETSLSLHMEQRSCDLFLGVPFNIASYALLTHMLAQVCGYKVGKLQMTLLDYHVYVTEGQSHEAQVMEQLKRTPYSMPKLILDPNVKNIDDFTMSSVTLSGYHHHSKLVAPLSTKVVARK